LKIERKDDIFLVLVFTSYFRVIFY